jgi:hypothetical protein
MIDKIIHTSIYSNYAFQTDEALKSLSNKEVYEILVKRYKILEINDGASPTEEEQTNNDIIYSRKPCYHHAEYTFYKYPEEATDDELMLICDHSCYLLCYGGKRMDAYYRQYYIFED